MKKIIFSLIAPWLIGAAPLLGQPAAPADVVGESLFPTELVQRSQDEIELTLEQRGWLRLEMEKSKQRIADLQARLQKEKEALAPLLKKERIDETAALAQSDKALDLDRDIRREHLLLLIRLKNQLTPAQQAKLLQIKARGAVFQEKLRKVQELARKQQAEGRDLSALQALQDQIEPLMKQGKLGEAEAVLDKALKLLTGN
jgi:Spy/CpxP family protein refolding chaperone